MPPSWWSSGARWHKCVPLWILDAKRKTQQASQSPINRSKTRRKHRKTYPGSAHKRPGSAKGRTNLTRGSKHRTEHHNRAAGAKKTHDGPQKTREDDNQSDNTTGDFPDACAFTIQINKDFLHGNTVVSTIFKKTKGVPSEQECVHAHPLQMGRLPLSFICLYIYIHINIYIRTPLWFEIFMMHKAFSPELRNFPPDLRQ